MSIDFRRAKVGTLLSVGIVAIIGLLISATVYSNYLTTSAQNTISSSSTRIFDVLTIQRDTEELFSKLNDLAVIREQGEIDSARKDIDSLLERADATIRESGNKEILIEEEFESSLKVLQEAKIVAEQILRTKEDSIDLELVSNESGTDIEYALGNQNEQTVKLRNIRYAMLGVFHDSTIRSDNEYRGAMDLVQRAQTITWVVIGASIVLASMLSFFLIRSAKKIYDLKNEFVNIIAHDLRNPVTAILGYMDLAKTEKDKNSAAMHNHLQTMEVAVHKLRTQINNLLEVGRSEAGYVKINLESVNALSVISESVVRAKALAEISEMEIKYKESEAKEVYVLADSNKLSDVLDNLVSNAIKYNRKKGTVTVSTQDAGEKFNISITDTGHGIPIDQQKKLFRKYSRLEGSTEKSVGGTGLGLYTVKLNMGQMKGTVSFTTKVNEGTTFTISLKKARKG